MRRRSVDGRGAAIDGKFTRWSRCWLGCICASFAVRSYTSHLASSSDGVGSEEQRRIYAWYLPITCTHTAHVTATMTHARALHNATRDDPAKITGSIFDFTSRGRRGSQRLERHGLVAAALALAFGHAGAEALCVAPTTSSSMIAQQASGGQRRTQWRRAATEGSSDGDGGRDGSSLSRKIVRVSWLRRPVFVWRLGAPCSAKERCMCVCVKIRQRATLDF